MYFRLFSINSVYQNRIIFEKLNIKFSYLKFCVLQFSFWRNFLKLFKICWNIRNKTPHENHFYYESVCAVVAIG